MDEHPAHLKIDKFIQDFRDFADASLWRGEDETVAMFAVGNVEDWLRRRLAELLN